MAIEMTESERIIPDFSGTTLNERYLLLRRIGHGGFSTVYEALDQQIDKQVAVKVLNPRYSRSAEYRKRFVQEARAAARIRHRLLVDVSDQGMTPDGLLYFVMELLHGVSLGERIRDRPGPVPWRFVVDLAVELAIALEFAHERGIVHRDVKPGNVFLVEGPGPGDAPQIKLLDLGIAKIHHDVPDDDVPETRESQGAPGTPEYMAPEQVREGAKGPSIDLYAVGVLMYRLLTGALPFTSKTPFEILRMHLEERPLPPSKRCPEAEIPPAVEALVLRAMEKRPEDRFGSATELRLALQELVHVDRPSPKPPALDRLSNDRLIRTASAFSRLTIAAITFMVLTVVVSPALQSATSPPRGARRTELGGPTPTPTPALSRPPARAPVPSPAPTPVTKPPEPAPPPTGDETDVVVLDDPLDPPPAPEKPKSAPAPKKAEPTPKKTPTSTGVASTKKPANTSAEITKKIERGRSAIESHCKKTTPKRTTKDTITAEVSVTPQGKGTAKIRGRQTPLGACIKAELEKLKYPGFRGAEPIAVTAKFTL